MTLKLPRWSDVIIEIHKTRDTHRYCQRINRNVKTSINHLRYTVELLEKAQLVTIIPTNRIKRINLTEKGKSVAVSLLKLKSELR